MKQLNKLTTITLLATALLSTNVFAEKDIPPMMKAALTCAPTIQYIINEAEPPTLSDYQMLRGWTTELTNQLMEATGESYSKSQLRANTFIRKASKELGKNLEWESYKGRIGSAWSGANKIYEMHCEDF